jgi:hypothetical protein
MSGQFRSGQFSLGKVHLQLDYVLTNSLGSLNRGWGSALVLEVMSLPVWRLVRLGSARLG